MSTIKKARNVAALSGGALVAAAPFIAPGAADAATFTVSNLNDSGAGSLRQAIIDANNSSGADTITFDAGLTGTITVSSHLGVNDSVDIQGPGASVLTVDGGDSTRIFYLYALGVTTDISISGLTISNGLGSGGAIFNFGEHLTLDSVVVTGNSGTYAPALYMSPDDGTHGTLDIRNSTFSDNASSRRGGAIGVWGTETSLDPVITIENCTFTGNSVAINSQGGSAIYLYNGNGPVRITNSTFTGNSSGETGTLYFSAADDVVIANSTITGNSGSDNAGISLYNGTHLTLENTILAGNTSTTSSSTPDLYLDGTSFATANYSLLGSTVVAGGANNVVSDSPLLGALADNGGDTETMMPLAGSPAINAGDPAFTAPPATDQRGETRVREDRIDIGAVETGTDPALPPTGGSNGTMAAAGAALLGLGGALHLSGRRKRTAPQA